MLAVLAGGAPAAAGRPRAAECTTASPEATTVCLINAERAERGLPELEPNRALASAAESYAAQMVRERRFEHVAEDGSTPAERIRRTGYMRGAQRWLVGEAIGWGGGDRSLPRAMVQAWMLSPGHRRLILDRRMKEIGAGVAPGSPEAVTGRVATYAIELGMRVR